MSFLKIHTRTLVCLFLAGFLSACGSGGGSSSSTPPAANASWTFKQAPPTRRQYAAAAVYDNKLYVMGGLTIKSDGTYDVVTDLVEIYDPATNTWATGVPMPTARMGLVAAAANGKIYAIGGRTNASGTSSAVATVEEFAPGATLGSGTWTTRASMSGPRYYAGGAMLPTATTGDHIVVAGGEASGNLLNTAEELNLLTGAWTSLSFMSSARSQFPMAESGGVLYIAGGYAGGGTPWLSTVEKYNPGTGGWTLMTPLQIERGFAVSAVINGRLLVVGGEKTAGSTAVLKVLESYDPSSNTWTTKTPAPSAFTRAAGGVIGNKLYIVGDGLTLEYDPTKETL